MSAAYIVTTYDRHGYVVSAHALCADHAAADNHAQRAIQTGRYSERDALGRPVITVASTNGNIPCDECHPPMQ